MFELNIQFMVCQACKAAVVFNKNVNTLNQHCKLMSTQCKLDKPIPSSASIPQQTHSVSRDLQSLWRTAWCLAGRYPHRITSPASCVHSDQVKKISLLLYLSIYLAQFKNSARRERSPKDSCRVPLSSYTVYYTVTISYASILDLHIRNYIDDQVFGRRVNVDWQISK